MLTTHRFVALAALSSLLMLGCSDDPDSSDRQPVIDISTGDDASDTGPPSSDTARDTSSPDTATDTSAPDPDISPDTPPDTDPPSQSGGWQQIHSGIPATAGAIGDLDFPDDNHGRAAFGANAIAYTDDGGTSWQLASVDLEVPVHGVSFPAPSTGWVVGDEGRIAHTADGGDEWMRQNTGLDTHLRAVDFPDTTHGFAVGDDATILATDDGGQTWNAQSAGADVDLVDVSFVDPQHGWAAGPEGTVLHTSDGGATWDSQQTGTSADIPAVSFVDTDFGRAVTDDADILQTDDGGSSWESLDFAGTELVDVHFPNRDYGLIAQKYGGIRYFTEDGLLARASSTEQLQTVFATDRQHAWAGGEEGRVEYTTDGEEWLEPERGIRAGEFRGIAAGDDTLWAAGPRSEYHSAIWRSDDGGESWSKARDVDSEPLADIDAGGGHAVAVGDRGKLFHRAPGTDTWQERDSDTARDLNDVEVTDEGMWAVGTGNGPIVRSTDGEQWSYVTSPASRALRAIHAFDADRAWTAATSQTFLYTDDGGDSWRTVDPSLEEDIRIHDMTFADPRHGWAVGTLGLVVRTDDGGDSWTAHQPPIEETTDLVAVQFADPDHGWIATGDGRLLETTDAGATWQQLAPRVPVAAHDATLGPDHAYLAGTGETLLRHTLD